MIPAWHSSISIPGRAGYASADMIASISIWINFQKHILNLK